MTTDPFNFLDPADIPSSFPTIQSLRGRLVLIQPTREDQVANTQAGPGATKQRITAVVTLVDGRGPVEVYKNYESTGQTLEGPEFVGMWIESEVIVPQLREALRVQGRVLARVDTKNPGQRQGKGNPWGLVTATDADRQMARDFLANRTISATQAPAQAGSPAPAQTAQKIMPSTSGGNPFA